MSGVVRKPMRLCLEKFSNRMNSLDHGNYIPDIASMGCTCGIAIRKYHFGKWSVCRKRHCSPKTLCSAMKVNSN
ncbi:hypothetical protein ACSBR2_006589 [Camellia fascicularis]